MRLILTRTFQKNFRKLPSKAQPQIEEALRKIFLNPQVGKKLSGELEGEFSNRSSRYRIIYFIDDEGDIWVETVRHRKNVYKKK